MGNSRRHQRDTSASTVWLSLNRLSIPDVWLKTNPGLSRSPRRTNPRYNSLMKSDRQFAINVTQKLQAAGFVALFAGGCVRDDLLGKSPKDYDVATNATPDQVRALFGHRRTLAIGASFGVITVLGPPKINPIEVATFRRDGGYSDGRRPDAVQFTDAREDAVRRDFTINGMFFDPVAQKIIDYVDGQTDLAQRQIRAIGDPHQRIQEDKLRMLRGVRFAATYDFAIEQQTMSAIQNRATEINVVSPERIGGEIVRMFSHSNFVRAFELLVQSSLWSSVLPGELTGDADEISQRFKALKRLRISAGNTNPAATVIAVLVKGPMQSSSSPSGKRLLSKLQNAWKLSNDMTRSIGWIIEAMPWLKDSDQRRWSAVQPWLIGDDAHAALDLIEAIETNEARTGDNPVPGVGFAREKLKLPSEKLNPNPFVTGRDLIEMGVSPGPPFKRILQSIRDGQLDNEISSRQQALQRISDLI